MNYTVKTKNALVSIKADNVCGGIEIGRRSDLVCFYAYYNDGHHKLPQKREVASFKEDVIEYIVSEEHCTIEKLDGEETE